MPRAAARPDALRGRVFRGRDAVAQDLLTRRQLASSAWRPLLRGVYADATLPLTHGVLITAASLALAPQAVIAGRSAGWWFGAEELVGPTDPVEVLVPSPYGVGPIRGVHVRRVETLAERDVFTAGAVRLTTPVRTSLDMARYAPDLIEAVVRLDTLLRCGVLRDNRRAEAAAALSGGRGSRQARRAFRLADGRADSPPESRLRVHLTLAGLPPVPQFVVRDRGRFVARVDLAYPDQRVAVEYDGRWHAETGQFGRDRRRLNALVAAGWRVIHVTAADLRDLDTVLVAVREALGA